MASLINRLTKAKPPPRLLASLNAALAPKSGPQSANPNLASSETLIPCDSKFDTSSRCSDIIFPSFPFGYCLNPSLYPPMGLPEPGESESEDSRTVWADSTKLKRKKKMNKHKHQKRMKLLRRKSRSK